MTPAVKAAEKADTSFELHQYDHDPNHPSYGEEAAEALGVPQDRVFKTLLVQLDGDLKRLAVGLIPVSSQLDLKAIASAAGAKKAAMADPKLAERTTGYVVGGISPLGQRKRLPTFIDQSATSFQTIYASAGRRGLEIELTAQDLIELLKAEAAPLTRG